MLGTASVADHCRGPGSGGGSADPGSDSPEAAAPAKPKRGERVVQLRPQQTDEGYKSVYSELTRPTLGSRIRTGIRATGEILITFGLVVLLFAVYEVYGKTAIVDAHQNELGQQLDQTVGARPDGRPDRDARRKGRPRRAPADRPPLHPQAEEALGGRRGRRRRPTSGTRPATTRAPRCPARSATSRSPGTASGRSSGTSTRSRPATPIVVETARRLVRLPGHRQRDRHAALGRGDRPDPDQPGVEPTKAMLTLTTCNPKWDNYQRMVVHAELGRDARRTRPARPSQLGS